MYCYNDCEDITNSNCKRSEVEKQNSFVAASFASQRLYQKVQQRHETSTSSLQKEQQSNLYAYDSNNNINNNIRRRSTFANVYDSNKSQTSTKELQHSLPFSVSSPLSSFVLSSAQLYDDKVIDTVVTMTSNLSADLHIRLRVQCVGLYNILQKLYNKHQKEQKASLLRLEQQSQQEQQQQEQQEQKEMLSPVMPLDMSTTTSVYPTYNNYNTINNLPSMTMSNSSNLPTYANTSFMYGDAYYNNNNNNNINNYNNSSNSVSIGVESNEHVLELPTLPMAALPMQHPLPVEHMPTYTLPTTSTATSASTSASTYLTHTPHPHYTNMHSDTNITHYSLPLQNAMPYDTLNAYNNSYNNINQTHTNYNHSNFTNVPISSNNNNSSSNNNNNNISTYEYNNSNAASNTFVQHLLPNNINVNTPLSSSSFSSSLPSTTAPTMSSMSETGQLLTQTPLPLPAHLHNNNYTSNNNSNKQEYYNYEHHYQQTSLQHEEQQQHIFTPIPGAHYINTLAPYPPQQQQYEEEQSLSSPEYEYYECESLSLA